MTTGTTQGRRNKGIAITQDKRGYRHFHRELPPPPPPDPATGRRRRLDKSDRIRNEARRKFDEALAEYERTGACGPSCGGSPSAPA